MSGGGGGWAKITKIIMAMFGHSLVKLYYGLIMVIFNQEEIMAFFGNFMVKLYLNSIFNILIGFFRFGLV